MKYHRIDGSQDINPASIAEHIHAGERVVVQYSSRRYDAQQLAVLNQLANNHGRSFEIRFFGHDAEVFDASVLQWLPDAQCISIDSIRNASNLESLSKLRNLAELSRCDNKRAQRATGLEKSQVRRRPLVKFIVPQRTRLEGCRVVRRQGAGISPVAVEVFGAFGAGGAAHFEEQGG